PMIQECAATNSYSFDYVDTHGREFIVNAEEYKKYKTIEEYIEEKTASTADSKEITANLKRYFASHSFRSQVYDSIGLIASTYKDQSLVNWPSPYVLYDKFSEDEYSDGNYEFAEKFYFTVKQQSGDHQLMETIWSLYLDKKSRFESKYRNLPKAVFQSDLNDSNLLLDDQLNLVGIIDFNLSGTETILNYIICECLYFLRVDDLDKLGDWAFMKQCDEHLAKAMSAVTKHYELSQQELDVINDLYNIVAPFRFPTMHLFIKDLKANNGDKMDAMLEWIYYQLTRSDIHQLIQEVDFSSASS
ncbi:hypothetical protein, partial [Paenibacillus albiflavus]